MPYQVSRITTSCNDLEGVEALQKMDARTWEDLRNPSPDHIVRKNVSNIIWLCFDKYLVVTQDRILHGLIKHKKLKRTSKLLGFQNAKSKKACVIVTENISDTFSNFGKSRKLSV